MKQAMVTIKYEEEKRMLSSSIWGRRMLILKQEMNEVLGKMYEKYVPRP